MLAAWLTGYLLGVFVGRCVFLDFLRIHGDVLLPVVAGAAFLPIFVRIFQNDPFRGWLGLRSLRGQVLWLGAAAFAWGVLLSAPIPIRTLNHVQIIRTATAGHGRESLLVSHFGSVYETVGQGAVGDLGQVRVSGSSGLALVRRTHFISRLNFGETTATSGILVALAESLRASLLRLAERYDSLTAPWLKGLLIGDQADLPKYVETAFKQTGIYHLLIVSGSHVTFVAVCLAVGVLGPWQLAYGARLIRPDRWLHLDSALKVFVLTASLLYAHLVGIPQSAQRAALGFCVIQGSLLFCGWLELRYRILAAAGLQVAVYPLGFWCESTLMSWSAYLLVLVFLEDSRGVSRWTRMGHIIQMQAAIALVMASLCGQLSLLGIVVNLVAVPVFSVIFLASAWLLLPAVDDLSLSKFMVGIIRIFIDSVVRIAELPKTFPWMVVDLTKLPAWCRIMFLFASALVLLNAFSRLTISVRDQVDAR